MVVYLRKDISSEDILDRNKNNGCTFLMAAQLMFYPVYDFVILGQVIGCHYSINLR